MTARCLTSNPEGPCPASRLVTVCGLPTAPLPFNVVVSNVPGPDVPFYCCGALVEAAYPMGPLTAWTGLNVTVLSYRDRLSFGLVTCPDVVDDVTELLVAIDDEFDDLSHAITRHHPQGGP